MKEMQRKRFPCLPRIIKERKVRRSNLYGVGYVLSQSFSTCEQIIINDGDLKAWKGLLICYCLLCKTLSQARLYEPVYNPFKFIFTFAWSVPNPKDYPSPNLDNQIITGPINTLFVYLNNLPLSGPPLISSLLRTKLCLVL